MNLWSRPSLKRLAQRSIQKRKEQQPPLVAKAKGRMIRMSPLKVRRVLNQIQGCSYEEALVLLRFLPYRACHPVAKVLKSAAANALNKYSIPRSYLRIEKAFVENGPTLKRIRPRAKGRMYPIKKRTSHIYIVVRSNFSRFENDVKGNFLPVVLTK
uniref:ribosomal protein L22 n=1 Tax=Neustupella aerophytica TaxID=2962111 RepID=UPI0021824078|nr:ribosomal protein L22 [Neustupella aerophytica]UVI61085.1 ribosomal protein L22 [Neustupella aerophytica]